MIRPLKRIYARLWNSISFRLTFNYGLLAILTTLILLAFIYFQVMGALHTQRYQQITATAQRMAIVYEDQGREGLIKAINLIVSDRIDSERQAYLLVDAQYHKLAGNIDALPTSQPTYLGLFQGDIFRNGRRQPGHFIAYHLADGSILFVGQDLSEIDNVTTLILQGIAAAIVLAMVLVMLGAYIFRRELEYRVGTIRQITKKVSAGQLSQRIPISHAEDEFTLLNQDINTMLDRIEALMNGVRHVSDTIAHNLRTPLTRVTGRLRLALQPGTSPDEMRQAAAAAMEEIESLNVLFGKMLQLAEIEAGVRRQTFRSRRLDVIVEDVFEMYSAVAEEEGKTLELKPCAPIWVPGDADLLASACANLIENGLKHARTGVTIGVFVDNMGCARVAISDDGPGIPATEFDRVGTRFYRLDASVSGHGLGLASVRAIMALHQGWLEFSDARPGLRASMCLPAIGVSGNLTQGRSGNL
ncbi:ATP-binding protein [Pusillimonas sp. ANT_WB101]|uniref:ATP-binding protein n=1 Tax=Pusillimonas sp. ANT_WB101 TaxID=2597356 RepID=UPI0011EC96EF|nr:ATP-binding protein [Pusillimonas sp. ANT_WB101]KAA0890034.1 HAMP domain-containing protein [Pusillimonas sp. ANT_WB101]